MKPWAVWFAVAGMLLSWHSTFPGYHHVELLTNALSYMSADVPVSQARATCVPALMACTNRKCLSRGSAVGAEGGGQQPLTAPVG